MKKHLPLILLCALVLLIGARMLPGATNSEDTVKADISSVLSWTDLSVTVETQPEDYALTYGLASTTSWGAGDTKYGQQLEGDDVARQVYARFESAMTPTTTSIEVALDEPEKFQMSVAGAQPTNGELLEGLTYIRQSVQAAIDAYRLDYPEKYYMDSIRVVYSVEYVSGSSSPYIFSVTTMTLNITLSDDAADTSAALAQTIANFSITGATDSEKIRSIHDSLCNLISYDYAAASDPDSDPHGYDAYGALVQSDHTAVCEGYAESFKLLCQRENITCILVVGYGGGGLHMWNYVRLDGKWLAVDVTWADPASSGGAISYAYYLKNKAEFIGHTPTNQFSQGGYVFGIPGLYSDYSVTATLTGLLSSNASTTAGSGLTYTTTFSVTNPAHILPECISVKMGDFTLIEGSDYTYSDGVLSVPYVSGPLVITANSWYELTTVGSAYLYGGPTTASRALKWIAADTEVKITGESGSFYGVKAGNDYGYILKTVFELSAPNITPESYTISVTVPDGYSGTELSIDGVEYAGTLIGGTLSVIVNNTQAKTVTMYKLNASNVPIGMTVWTLDYDASTGYTAAIQDGLTDLLSYHGFSIRITGYTGLRCKTGISTQTRAALLSNAGVNGYKLVEYGTLVMLDSNYQLYPFIKDCDKVVGGRAYWEENGTVNDRIFETVNDRYRFTSVLTSLPVNRYNVDYAFRGYIILEKDDVQTTFYGPVVVRSMYYVANQIMDSNQYWPGSGAYTFISDIIATVEN